jgi:hypothetical protein
MSSASAEGLPTVRPSAVRPLEEKEMNVSILPGTVDSLSDDRGTAEWATRVLLDHGMPPNEIRAVLTTDDTRVVRRHMELHQERLLEELLDCRRALEELEGVLSDAARERAGRDRRR